ncbi:MAG TPA: AMP-binding protein [Verrucomicrobiae bacterium]
MDRANTGGFQVPAEFNFSLDVLDRWARVRPEGPALWCANLRGENEQRYSFHELSDLSHRAANFLASCGFREGDPVLIMLPRVPPWWIAMLGLVRMGAVPVPATLLLTKRDVEYRVETAGIRGVITNAEGAPKVSGFEGIRVFVNTSAPSAAGAAPVGWLDFQKGIAKASASFHGPKTRSDAPGVLYFTSATTGEPKMVMHTQASYGLGHRVTGEYWLDLKPGDVHWNISDLGWGKAAWSSFYGPWHQGACVFALDAPGKFDAALTLDTLANFPISTWCAPPTALRLIVRQDLSRWKIPRLRHCVTAGEPLNPEVLHLWRAATGLTLYEGYGQTETVVLIANCRSLGEPVQPGSMGKVVPGAAVSLVDENLKEVPPGEEGEVAVRVRPQRPLGLFREYWLNVEETARKFQGDWYLTGDRAVRDKDGYFWFVGRRDDVIKSSGYRIGPFEVESALLEHPAVLDVGVIGKPDPLRGQIVKACIVLRHGVVGTEELKSELQVHCKKLIAAYKYPREIEFVEELPKTTSGKTRHVELRRAAAK